MARTLIAYFRRADAPARKALQQAIDQFRLKLMLDDSYAPFQSEGYLPCTVDGEDAGFDLRFGEIGDDVSPALKSGLESRDAALRLRWSGDPREQFAALLVCAAFAGQFDAIVHDPDLIER